MGVNAVDHPDLFDTIVLAGKRSPGVATLSGHDRNVEWDVKDGPGLTGATMSPKKIPPVAFQVSFYLVKDDAEGDDQFAAWDAFKAVIESSLSGSTPKALDIYHPDLAAQTPPITSVCKASVGGPTYDGLGGKTVVVKFQEYRPAKKVSAASPTGSKAKPKPKDDPDAAALAELAKLTTQYQATPWA